MFQRGTHLTATASEGGLLLRFDGTSWQLQSSGEPINLLAMTTLNALRSRGVRVPHDVRIAGYDDVDLARQLHPSLTTVRQSIERAGAAMVGALLHAVSGHTNPPILLPTELVVRESSIV